MRSQFMSIAALVLVALMVTELFIFVLIVVGYDNLFQYSSVASTSTDYGALLSNSANSFAQATLKSALNALLVYEYNATARKDNFVTNMSNSISWLVENGMLPNVQASGPAGTLLASYMKYNTFNAYNSNIINVTGFSTKNVIISETWPVITQYAPYSLSIRYIESVTLNTSGSSYVYNIPVNASVPLNNTPDLLYAEQGILRAIRFANASNLVQLPVAGLYAVVGNNLAYTYGTVVNVQGAPTCASLSGLSSPISPDLQNPPFNSQVIIVTPNAMLLDNTCQNGYSGLITFTNTINWAAIPTKPYLLYPPPSVTVANIINYLPTGTKVLIYGPGLYTVNIERMRNYINNNFYMASPFTPSYIQRVQRNVTSHSQYGIFSLDTNRGAAAFSGASGAELTVSDKPIYSTIQTGVALTAWVYVPPGNTEMNSAGIACKGNAGSERFCLDFCAPACSNPGQNGNNPRFFFWNGAAYTANDPNVIGAGAWHFLAGTFDTTTSVVKLYVDGIYAANSAAPGGTLLASPIPNPISIGNRQNSAGSYTDAFNGIIANVQLYNASLTPEQVWSLYQQGIGSIPIANNALVGWWPLNGNQNDSSGYNNNGMPSVPINFNTQLVNNMRDAIFSVPEQGKLYPIPGALNCESQSECNDPALAHLYLGTSPLETGSNLVQAPNFNGANSVVNTNFAYSFNSMVPPLHQAITVSAWIYVSNTFKTNQGVLSMLPWNVWNGGAGRGTMAIVFNELGNGCNLYIKVFTPPMATSSKPSTNCVPIGGWTHVVAWVENVGKTYGMYINGALATPPGPFNGGGLDISTALSIGGGWQKNLSGAMTNVQIYNFTLTQAQASQLYAEGVAGLPLPGVSGLVGWYQLNGNLNDSSGNNNNGVPINVSFVPIQSSNTVPGTSRITSTRDEWQSFGLSDPH